MAHGAMMRARKQKSDTRLIDTLAKPRFGQVEFDAERFEHICAACLRRHRAIAVLRDAAACRCNDNCARGRCVEAGPAKAACAARVERRAPSKSILRALARSVLAPASSSAPVSPRTASPIRKAPICSGGTSPDRIAPKVSSRSAAESDCPAASNFKLADIECVVMIGRYKAVSFCA